MRKHPLNAHQINEFQNNLKANDDAINVKLCDFGKTSFQQGLQLH